MKNALAASYVKNLQKRKNIIAGQPNTGAKKTYKPYDSDTNG